MPSMEWTSSKRAKTEHHFCVTSASMDEAHLEKPCGDAPCAVPDAKSGWEDPCRGLKCEAERREKKAKAEHFLPFGSESIREGVPDACCDQASEIPFDACGEADPSCKAGCDTACGSKLFALVREIAVEPKPEYDADYESFVDDLLFGGPALDL